MSGLSGIYYFSNAHYAGLAFGDGSTLNVTNAIYHDSGPLSSSPNTQNWNSAVVNSSKYGQPVEGNPSYYNFPDENGRRLGWRISYSNKSGSLAADGAWILGGSAIGGTGDATGDAYSTATLLFLSPAIDSGNLPYVAPTQGGPSGVNIYIGVLSYNTGNTPSTDPPDSITVAGLTTNDGQLFYKTQYLSNNGKWKVNK